MKRKQIYLEDSHEQGVRRLAQLRGVAEAVVIRDAITEYLAARPARPELKSMADHPLARLIGIDFDPEGPKDGAVNHDHYLYGAPKVEE